MKKIRLCVITPAHWSAFMGGAQYQAKCILDELLPTRRYDVTYLANRVDSHFRTTDYKLIKIGGEVPRLGYMMHARTLYRTLKEIRPDVIYERVACGYTGIAAWYAKRNDCRMIWHVAHDGDVSPGRLEHGRNPMRKLLELRSVEYAIRHAASIVTQTHFQAELLRSNYDRCADAVVPNFHPLPTERIDKSGQFTVLWVANLKPWKQPEVFVRVAAALSALTNVKFVMIGAPPAASADHSWYDQVRRRIEDTPNVTYLGQLSQSEVNEQLARAHLFVNTSLHEGFANTFIQAWMREVPVLSLHVNPDNVFDRERVGLFAGSEQRLQDAVRRFVNDPTMLREYGQSSARYARAKHSSKNVATLESLIRGESDTAVRGPEAGEA